jgi:hypothetical protein
MQVAPAKLIDCSIDDNRNWLRFIHSLAVF